MTTSFAKTISPSGIDAPSTRKAFDAGANAPIEAEQGRGSSMVEKTRPAPAPRPSPDIAGGSDRAAFNARWETEQREARKAAFMQMRKVGRSQTKARSLNPSAKPDQTRTR